MRTALVTGAARGIGRATVEAFAARGWRVVAGVRDPGTVQPFAAPDVRVVRLDVTDAVEVAGGVAAAEDAAGGALACVVNGAGWALLGAVEDVDLATARREFETNLFGALTVLQAALPGMRRSGGGVVINVSTLGTRLALPLFGMYHATKSALAAVSEALAMEGHPFGLRVHVVEPGIVRTELARSTIVSGGLASGDSPYQPLMGAVLGKIRGIRDEAGLAPAIVAEAIVNIAEDPAAPFRTVLGDTGLLRLANAREGTGDEEFHDAVRGFLGLAEEPSTP